MRADLPVDADRAMESEGDSEWAISLPDILRSVARAYAHINRCAMHAAEEAQRLPDMRRR